MNKRLKLLLLILWMVFIFIMSSFDGIESSNQSNFIVNIIANIFNIKNIELLSIIIRKLAHFTEYFILGILAYNYLIEYNQKIYLTVIICIIYAITDELHQIITPDRVFSIYDILIDSSGAIIGAYLFKKIKK